MDNPTPIKAEFKPTPAMRRAKARFWTAAEDNPMIDVTQLTIHEIGRLAENTSILEWHKRYPGEFQKWFTSKNEIRTMVREGAESAVARLIKIINAENVGPREPVTTTNQLQAAKLLVELANLMPAQQSSITVKNDRLPETEDDLRKYIADGVKKLKLASGDSE